MTGTCPLCTGACETKEGGESTLFRCEACKPYRMSPSAIKVLATLDNDMRAALKHNVAAAHERGEIVEIRRAEVGSNQRFTCYYK